MTLGIGLIFMAFTSSFMFSNPTCPRSYTNAPKAIIGGQVKNCTNCHGDFSINTGGGSVVATGLPSGTYTPGTAYNFTIKINHGTSDKTVWGFAIKAVNTVDNTCTGTFSTTNANASVKGSLANQDLELSHATAATSGAANNYTYLNLKWTAPASPTANESNIRFYIVGVAGDNDGSEAGDYVYSTTVNAVLGTLPVTLSSFNVTQGNSQAVNIKWQTAQEVNTARFELEASDNGNIWKNVTSIAAKGNSTVTQSYAYTDMAATVSSGTYYYRLKIVDKDGTVNYSTIKSIQIKGAAVVIVPATSVPAKTHSNIAFKLQSNGSKSFSILVSDNIGRMLYKKELAVNSGTNTIEIPGNLVSNTSGIIYIRFSSNGFEQTFKQVIE